MKPLELKFVQLASCSGLVGELIGDREQQGDTSTLLSQRELANAYVRRMSSWIPGFAVIGDIKPVALTVLAKYEADFGC